MPPAGKYATTSTTYPQGTAPVPVPEEEAGPPPQPAYVPESSASYQYTAPPPPQPDYAAPPPQPEYVATDPGYDVAYPGPPPQSTYQPETAASSYYYEPLPQSPSMAGPPAPPPPQQQYGLEAPRGNDIVTSTYPATGTTTVMTKKGAVQPYYPIQAEQTYRTIPPKGSTYPTRETAYGVPPRDWNKLQDQYVKGQFPDTQPYFHGEDPRTDQRGGPNSRLIPADTWFGLRKPYWRGEGAMGARDPLSPYGSEDRPAVTGVGRYVWGMGETRPEDVWRPGTGSPYDEATMERARAKPGSEGHVPPEGYVPEIWDGRGGYMSSYWLEKAPPPEELLPHGAGYEPKSIDQIHDALPPPTPSYTNADTLAAMERRRRERRLRGLFGGG